MHDRAEHLVERVLPEVPIRPYVLSPPSERLGLLVARGEALSALGRIFIDSIFRGIRSRNASGNLICGAVVFVKPFTKALDAWRTSAFREPFSRWAPDRSLGGIESPQVGVKVSVCRRMADRVRGGLKKEMRLEGTLSQKLIFVQRLGASVLLAAASGLVGCGGSELPGTGAGAAGIEPGKGRFSVSAAVEAPAQDRAWSSVDALNVEIIRIRVKTDKGWAEDVETSTVVNLLDLKQGGLALASFDFPEGTLVKEVRLVMPKDGVSEVVMKNGQAVSLKVPSGSTSGVKLKGRFTVEACRESLVKLVIDGKKSIHYHQKGTGEYQMRPVIKSLRTQESVDDACAAEDDGSFSDAPQPSPEPEFEPTSDPEATPDEEQDSYEPPPVEMDPSDDEGKAPGGSCAENSDCASYELCSTSGTCVPNL